jgi:hypothetical protein
VNPCGNSSYITSSLTRRWVCLLWICLAFRQVYISHIYYVIEKNSYFCTTHKSSVNTGLHILCYNGSVVTWTVVSLTTAKLKPVWQTLLLQCFGEQCKNHLFQQYNYCVLSRYCALNGSWPWILALNQLKLLCVYQIPSDGGSIVACVTGKCTRIYRAVA